MGQPVPPSTPRLRVSRRLAILLDDLVRIPGTKQGVGLDALLGLVADLDVRSVERPDGQRTVESELHVAGSRRFLPGRRDLFFYVEAIAGVTGWFEMPLTQRIWDEGPSDVTVFGYDPATQKIDIVGHSMGGLVARSACCQASELGHDEERRAVAVLRQRLGVLPELVDEPVGAPAAGCLTLQ